jgi:thiol-disulfide isomerase/thioredoxin
MIKVKSLCILLFVVIGLACERSESQTHGNLTPDDTSASKFSTIKEITPIKADQISELVASYSGEKAVLINIWATWCIPCVEEFPHITQVQKEHPDDLQVVFISADFPEEIDRIHEFLRTNEVDWQTYLKDDRDEPFINSIWPDWSGAIPATVIYNKDGTNLTFFERSATYEEFKELALTAINNK